MLSNECELRCHMKKDGHLFFSEVFFLWWESSSIVCPEPSTVVLSGRDLGANFSQIVRAAIIPSFSGCEEQ